MHRSTTSLIAFGSMGRGWPFASTSSTLSWAAAAARSRMWGKEAGGRVSWCQRACLSTSTPIAKTRVGTSLGIGTTICAGWSGRWAAGQGIGKRSISLASTSMAAPPAGIFPPRNILIVNKLRTDPVVKAIDELLIHVRSTYPEVQIYAENRPDIPEGVQAWKPGPSSPDIDLVVTLGGDGTILHAASLFSKGAVPPVLSFSMGTLGFLLPFHIDDFVKSLEAVFLGKATILNRMRLTCTFYDKDGNRKGDDEDRWQVMNEIALHRGASPHLNTIDIFVDGQHLTEAVSDGIIVSTPTGSTAYSLSAGGPIVHPSLAALVLVPICPRSLSFRPLVFPRGSVIRLQIGGRSRASAGVSMDGRSSLVLDPGDSVTVHASPYPVPCINRSSIVEDGVGRGAGREEHVDGDGKQVGGEKEGVPEDSKEGVAPGKEDDWVRDINNLLQYNATFRSKQLLRYR